MKKCLKDKTIYVFGTGARKVTQIPFAIKEFTRDGAKVYTMLSEMGQNLADSLLSEFSMPGNTIVPGYSTQGEELPLEDLVLVAPCTFNTLNKLASGVADTYPLTITATAIGAGKKVILAPAMNAALWAHPIALESVRRLEKWGCKVVWPDITPEKVTMAPIEKVADAVYHTLAGVKYDARQVPEDEGFRKIVNENYSAFREMGGSLSDMDLTRGSAGCLSMRVNRGFLVTSSGSQIGSLSKEELSLVRRVEDETIVWQGNMLPSSESPILSEIYGQFPRVDAIVHSHCPRITYDAKMQKYCTPDYIRYGTFGEGAKVFPVIEKNNGFAILRYHGEITTGKTIAEVGVKLQKRLEEAHGK